MSDAPSPQDDPDAPRYRSRRPSRRPATGCLTGKVVVVTAAAGTGIGFATAKRCIEEGATVVVSDAHERRLGEAADALAEVPEARGVRPLAVPCNVTVEAEVQAPLRRGGDRARPVRRGGQQRRARRPGRRGGDDRRAVGPVLDVTLTGHLPVHPGRPPPLLRPGGGGVIVNNACVLGWRAQAGQAHYAAAKAGVMALTRCTAVEAAPHGVRVNAVSPSLAVHPFLNKVMADEELAELARREVFGRGAEVWEVANVIVFLASEYATFMTGEVVSVSSQHP